jgi:uncharacterized membrane protein required for colicin V production
MGILIDIILIAIVALSIWNGAKRGFVRSVMNMITFITAFLCGWYFYPPLAVIYNDNFLLGKISTDIYNAINSIISNGAESINLSRLFADKPDAFLEITKRYSADINTLEKYFNAQVNAGANNITADISARIAEPVATGLSKVLAFLTIFFGIVILLKIVTLILDLVFKLPVLNVFNHVAGFILGSVSGLAYAWILSVVIAAALPFLSMLFPAVFSQNTGSGSILLNLFTKISSPGIVN